jgi:hypothetical protein
VKRIVTATLITAGVLVSTVATVAALATVVAAPAQAEVVAVALPSTATITSKTLTLTGAVRVGRSDSGVRSAAAWFVYPGAALPTLVGTTSSRRPGFLAITVRIDATRVVAGPNQLQIIDAADGDSRIVPLDLLRQSRVAITHAEPRSHGRMALAVRVTHYNPKTDKFIASRRSPIRLQERVNGSWVTLITVTSDKLGLAGAAVPAGPGVHLYRAVRPDGETVRTATSLTIRAARS